MENEYNYETGKLYDTVFFITMYLFEDEMIKRVFTKSNSVKLEHDLRFYYQLKKNCDYISKKLKPFFYCSYDENILAFLINYIGDNVYYDSSTFEKFINVFSDIDDIKSCFIDYYFSGLTMEDYNILYYSKDIESMSDIISKIKNMPDNYKMNFLVVFQKFDFYIDLLIRTLKSAYNDINKLHNENLDIIQDIEKLLKDENINFKQKASEYFSLEVKKPCFYSFSLLNPYGVFFRKEKDKYIFRVGEEFLATIYFWPDYAHVTDYSFFRLLGNKTIYKIYNLLFEYHALCVSDIMSCLKLTRAEVKSCVDEMCAEKIICHVKGPDLRIYYSLNEIFLAKIHEYTEKQKQNYARFKREEKQKYYVRPRNKKTNLKDKYKRFLP